MHKIRKIPSLRILLTDLKRLTGFSFGSTLTPRSTPRRRSRSRSPPQQTPEDRITQVTRSPRRINTSPGDCSICHDRLNNGQQVVTLDCPGYHRFHRDCICGWYRLHRNNTTCPMCRAPVDLRRICGRLSPVKKPFGDITNQQVRRNLNLTFFG